MENGIGFFFFKVIYIVDKVGVSYNRYDRPTHKVMHSSLVKFSICVHPNTSEIAELHAQRVQHDQFNNIISWDDWTVQVTHVKFNGVDVKLYEPRERPSGKRPGLIYYHGGGWTTGSAGRVRMDVTSVTSSDS